jgi:hypothetical protein
MAGCVTAASPLLLSCEIIFICSIVLIEYNRVKEDGMGRACSTHGEKRYTRKVLEQTPEGKRPLGRSRRRWEDILKWILEK